MVEFLRKLNRLKTLTKNRFKRNSAKLPNHEDTLSTKQIPDLMVPTLALQERVTAGKSRIHVIYWQNAQHQR